MKTHDKNELLLQVAMGVLVILGVAFAIFRFSQKQVGTLSDDAYYIVLAKSLFSGAGYQLINFPDNTVSPPFPPGWPFILGAYWKLFPVGLEGLKIPAFLFWLGSLFLAFKLFAPTLNKQQAIVFWGLLCLNARLMHISNSVSSEPAFLFFSLLALLFFMQWRTEERVAYRFFALALLCALVATSIRTVGIALLAMMGITAVWQWRTERYFNRIVLSVIGLGLIAIIILLLNPQQFVLVSALYQQHVSYIVGNLGQFVQFWNYGASFSPPMIANLILPIFSFEIAEQLLGALLLQILSVAVLTTVFIGLVSCYQQWDSKTVYFGLYLLIFYLWTAYIAYTQTRILIPLIPFLLYYLILGVQQAVSWLPNQEWRLSEWVALGILWSVVGASILFNGWQLMNPFEERSIDLTIGASWIREHSAEDVIVMSTNPVNDYLYLDRTTVSYDQDTPFAEQLMNEQADYFLLHPPVIERGAERQVDAYVQNEILPYFMAHETDFALVFQNKEADVWVFQRMSTP